MAEDGPVFDLIRRIGESGEMKQYCADCAAYVEKIREHNDNTESFISSYYYDRGYTYRPSFGEIAKQLNRILLTFYYWDEKRYPLLIEHYPDVFMDSGAFSAWSQSGEVNLDKYIKRLKEHENQLTAYAALDVIGDPQASFNNWLTMKAAGLNPLPTVHCGIKNIDKWLRIYLDKHGLKYIALGGMVGRHKNKRMPFLKKAFSIINDYWPVKVHAFGVGDAVSILEAFPFYSADSTGWLKHARYGKRSSNDKMGEFLHKKTTATDRALMGVKQVVEREKYLTELWTEWGIIWEN